MNEDFNVNPICVTPWDGRYKGVGFNMLFLLKKIREVQRCQEKSPQRSSEFRRAQKGSEGLEQQLLQCVQMCTKTPPALEKALVLLQNCRITE